MDFIEHMQLLFNDCKSFFNKIRLEPWSVAYQYSVAVGLALGIVGVLSQGHIALVLVPFAPLLVLLVLLSPFLNSILPHLGAMLFGKSDYWKTFKPIVYGRLVGVWYLLLLVPLMILMRISNNSVVFWTFLLVAAATTIHTLYAQVEGMHQYQGLSYTQSVLAVLVLPLLIALVVGIVVALNMAS